MAEVQACIDAYAMFPAGSRVIVAVSGGPDSMALLSILYHLRRQYSLMLLVAHVNHQLRGEEAGRDALFVKRQAARLGLPFYQTQVDVKRFQHTSGLSPQHAARHLRYAFFSTLQRSVRATRIALGHTAEDQAETLLMRLLRGGGPAALAGIPAVRLPFVRPLITTSRQAIMAYLHQEHIPWVVDSSNTQRTYLRNRIRLDLLPALQSYNPRLIKRLNELAAMLRADNEVLEHQTEVVTKQVVRCSSAHRVVIQCEPYQTAPLALQRRILHRLMVHLLEPASTASFQHLEALRRLIMTGTLGQRLTLPGNILAERHLHTVWLWRPHILPPTTARYLLPVPGKVDIPVLNTRLCADIIAALAALEPPDHRCAFLDLALLRLPLIVRFPQSGDRVYPLGAPGHKKLKAFFIDRKVPRAERPYVPLVVSGEEIAWVVGYRIAEPFKVRPETRHMVRLQYQPCKGKPA